LNFVIAVPLARSFIIAQCRLLAEATPTTRLARSTKRVDDDTRSGASHRGRVAAKYGDSRSEFRATQGDHVLADVDCDLLSLMMVGIHQNPLYQIVAVLVTGNINQRNARTIWVCGSDDAKVAFEELNTANLQALLYNLGGKLTNAVAVGIAKDVVNDSALVWRGAVLAEMLDTPVSELPVGNEVDVCDDFFNGGTLEYC
jgi:hypothetical protein